MTAIFDLIKATKGKFTADEVMEFFKSWKNPDSPRGRSASTRQPVTSSRTSISAGRKGRRQARQRRDRDIPNVKDPWEGAEPPRMTIG